MKIETKFNINDTFFTIIGRNTIAERKVKAIIFEDNTISYSAGNLDISYSEGSCFKSMAEAQAECNKKNKGE